MRAAQYEEFGGPITVREVSMPSAEPGGVVIAVKATGVCRSDWHGWAGHDSDIADHGLPFTPGHELSGTVHELGEGVQRFAVGDRVAIPFILSCGTCRECGRGKPTVCEQQQQPGFTRHGSFAEYVALPRADRNLTKLPDDVSYAAAAALGCRTTTAYRAVIQQGRLQAGEWVAVFGCGGVGLSAVMVAVAAGANVIAVDVNKPALDKATAELGAIAALDASLGDDYVREQVKKLTDGVGADLTVDAAGFSSTCENAVWCARRAGRVVQVGLPLGGVQPNIPMARVAGWELELIGSHGIAASDFPAILELVRAGKLNPELLIERECNLEEGAAAIMAMDAGSPLGMTMVTSFGEAAAASGPRAFAPWVVDEAATPPTGPLQTNVTVGSGNALQACVAALFGLSLDNVPNFITLAAGYEQGIRDFAAPHSVRKIDLTDPAGAWDVTRKHPGAVVILRGGSPRGSHAHVVLARVAVGLGCSPASFKPLFDPHPEGNMLDVAVPHGWAMIIGQ